MNKEIILRCLVGACDEGCPFYEIYDDIDGCKQPLNEMKEWLNKAEEALKEKERNEDDLK